jgi:hypothetical protein
MRTTMAVAVAAVIAAVLASQRQDIARYIRIRQMSAGPVGHPEFVPAEGRKAYPH